MSKKFFYVAALLAGLVFTVLPVPIIKVIMTTTTMMRSTSIIPLPTPIAGGIIW